MQLDDLAPCCAAAVQEAIAGTEFLSAIVALPPELAPAMTACLTAFVEAVVQPVLQAGAAVAADHVEKMRADHGGQLRQMAAEFQRSESGG